MSPNICSRILTPLQTKEPICWFLTTLVAMFYSQRSRKLMIDASKKWDKHSPLFKSLKRILKDKYLKEGKGDSYEYRDFADKTFLDLLILLFEKNKDAFPFDPRQITEQPFYTEIYIGKLYKLLGVDYKMFDYVVPSDRLTYSSYNNEYNFFSYNIINGNINTTIDYNKVRKIEESGMYVDNMKAPPILILKVTDDIGHGGLKTNLIINPITKWHLKSMDDIIFYNEVEYHLDSVILLNMKKTKKQDGHFITGITCKKKRYLYNGLARTIMNPTTYAITNRGVPCSLVDYNWDIKRNERFCFNMTTCNLKILKPKDRPCKYMFNFSKGGYGKLLIYVRKDSKSVTSSMKDIDIEVFLNAQHEEKMEDIIRGLDNVRLNTLGKRMRLKSSSPDKIAKKIRTPR